MSVIGREVLHNVGSGREALPDVREWSRGPLRSPGVVNRPYWMSGSGREVLPYVR